MATSGLKILMVDGDPHLCAVVQGVVAGEGHRLHAVSRLGEVESATPDADLLLIDVDLAGGAVPELLRRLRPAQPELCIVLVSVRPRDDAALSALQREVGALAVLRRPFSLLDLNDLLRRVPKAPRERGAGSTSGVERLRLGASSEQSLMGVEPSPSENPARIARLWASQSSGVLHITSARGSSQTLCLSDGGPTDARGLRLLEVAFDGGRLVFEPGEAEGLGEAEALGSLLYDRMRDPGRSRFAVESAFKAPARTPWSPALERLPVDPGLRRLAMVADGQALLGDLLASLDLSADAVSADLELCHRLRLLALQAPVSRPRASQPPARSAASRSRAAPPIPPRGTAPVAPLAGPAAAPLSLAPTSVGSGRTSSSSSRSSSEASAGGPNGAGGQQRVAERLQRELERLRGANAAVVLGVPADASSELIREAAARMRLRYAEIVRRSDSSPELREAAGELLSLVERSTRTEQDGTVSLHASLSYAGSGPHGGSLHGGGSVGGDPTSMMGGGESPEERLLQRGRSLITQSAWEQADRVLSRARDRRIDHPAILANLAWARLHNPGLPSAQREEDACDLLLLAEQFDAHDPEGQRYLALYLERRGDLGGALRRAQRAQRAQPTDIELQGLVRRLKASQGA